MRFLNSTIRAVPPSIAKPEHSGLTCLICIASALFGSHALAEEFGNHVMQSLEGRWQLNQVVTKELQGGLFAADESKDVAIRFAMDRPEKAEAIGKFQPSERGFLYRTLGSGKMTQDEKTSSFELLADEYGNTWLNQTTNEIAVPIIGYEVTIARGIRPEHDILILKAHKGGLVIALSRSVEAETTPPPR